MSLLWRQTRAKLGIQHIRTRARRPQTNGKIERFHRTLGDGWGYARCYASDRVTGAGRHRMPWLCVMDPLTGEVIRASKTPPTATSGTGPASWCTWT